VQANPLVASRLPVGYIHDGHVTHHQVGGGPWARVGTAASTRASVGNLIGSLPSLIPKLRATVRTQAMGSFFP
jgi:hypothetical protein